MNPTTKPLPTLAAVADRLNALGWAVAPHVPGYALRDTLKRFQSACGIVPDGEFGPVTNGYLFLNQRPNGTATEILLRVAASQLNIEEVPYASNSGPQVNQYQRTTGNGKGDPWCMSYLYWCVEQTCRMVGYINPLPKTGHCMTMWNRVGKYLHRVSASEARTNPALVKPGMIAIWLIVPATGAGHTGLVISVGSTLFPTYEGNSNIPTASREGVAVVRQTKRRLTDKILIGFIQVF